MTDQPAPNDDPSLDRALAALPNAAPDPLWSRATRVAAERRLQSPQRISVAMRYEPFLLIALSAMQLAWATLRVFALAR